MKRFDYLPWLLAFGIAVILMSTDMYAPAMPAMRLEFHASEADILRTITINSLGYCAVSLFLGPLSDAIGRRSILVWSVLGFTICCFGCVSTTSLDVLYVMRFLQGLFGSALPIAGIAMLADRYHGRKLGSLMAYIGIVITLSFAVAPIIGGFISDSYGWRTIFLILGILSAIVFVLFYFRLPETVKQKTAFNGRFMLEDYKLMLSDRPFILLGLVTAFSLAGFFAYVTSSSYLYIEQFHVSSQLFGILTGIGMTTNALSHMVVGRLVSSIGNYRVLKLGMAFQGTAAVLMGLLTSFGVTDVFVLLVPVMFFNASLGFTFPPATTIALERFPKAAGTAASLMGTTRMGMIAFSAWLSGVFYDGTLISISSIMILFACLVIICFLWVSIMLRRSQQAA